MGKAALSETDSDVLCLLDQLLVSEMDERDFKTLEAGKVGNVLISLVPRSKFATVAQRRCGTLSQNNKLAAAAFAHALCGKRVGSATGRYLQEAAA